MFLETADNQYGFKQGYGQDMCIFAFKEVVNYYVKTCFQYICYISGCANGI